MSLFDRRVVTTGSATTGTSFTPTEVSSAPAAVGSLIPTSRTQVIKNIQQANLARQAANAGGPTEADAYGQGASGLMSYITPLNIAIVGGGALLLWFLLKGKKK